MDGNGKTKPPQAGGRGTHPRKSVGRDQQLDRDLAAFADIAVRAAMSVARTDAAIVANIRRSARRVKVRPQTLIGPRR